MMIYPFISILCIILLNCIFIESFVIKTNNRLFSQSRTKDESSEFLNDNQFTTSNSIISNRYRNVIVKAQTLFLSTINQIDKYTNNNKNTNNNNCSYYYFEFENKTLNNEQVNEPSLQ